MREDLATLLGERFAAGAGVAIPSSSPREPDRLPVVATSLIGRAQELDDVDALVERPGARLVTLTGPGGIGKTRLAAAVGERVRDRLGARTVFAPGGPSPSRSWRRSPARWGSSSPEPTHPCSPSSSASTTDGGC